MKIDDVAAQLEALGNPTRLKLYRTLVKVGPDGISVGQLQSRLGTAASTLSHHLQRMIQVGLVTQERQATTLICRANYDVMNRLVGYLTEECCVEQDSCRTNVA
jgi:ArsR family transcriptional regulator, arsenate/arsenite/antimonite-responsive transcriptional repressor